MIVPLVSNLRAGHSSVRIGRALTALLMTVLVLESSGAAEALTVNFPIETPTVLPERLSAPPRQVATPDGVGYAEFFLQPNTGDDELFVTVLFQEDGSTGPGLFWAGEGVGAQTTLSEDLGEKVTGYNRRTVRVPKALSVQAGRLILTGDQSKIRRVRLDWASPGQTYAAADQKPVSLLLADRFFSPADLEGGSALSPPDAWFGKVLEASLQEEPAALESNLEFVVTLGQKAGQALLATKFLGLPFDSAPVAWVNGTRVGPLQVTVPPLTDAGYLPEESGAVEYAGWRAATLLIPTSLLKEGENSILIETSADGVFLRETTLQLRPTAADSAAAPPDHPFATDL